MRAPNTCLRSTRIAGIVMDPEQSHAWQPATVTRTLPIVESAYTVTAERGRMTASRARRDATLSLRRCQRCLHRAWFEGRRIYTWV